MTELINTSLIKETSRDLFRTAFLWYNDIYSRKKKISDDDLNQIFERIHTEALEIYEPHIWDSLITDDTKLWYSEKPDNKRTFPLVAVLVNYGNAMLNISFSELAYPDNPDKANIELLMFFIYAYVKAMKSTQNVTTLLPPDLLPSAINPIITSLLEHHKDMRKLNNLSVNLLIDIFRLNNKMNQANKLEGLYSNHALNELWKNIWERYSDDTKVGLIMLDGDNFKKVNDNCGHGVGDRVLEIYRDSILSAIALSGKLKIKAFPARWGGEEFCICIFDCNEDDIINLSKKIQSELKVPIRWEDLAKKEYENQTEPIVFPRTFSQGIAFGKKSQFDHLNILVKEADDQMYKAKHAGKDRIYYGGHEV